MGEEIEFIGCDGKWLGEEKKTERKKGRKVARGRDEERVECGWSGHEVGISCEKRAISGIEISNRYYR